MPAQNTYQYYFVQQSLHKVLPSTTSYYRSFTKYLPVLLRTTKLAQSTSQYYFVLQSLHKDFPVLLRTTKLAQSTFQYYFVLQSLHKVLPSTASYYKATSYYKACTKCFPVLLRTTKLLRTANLAQSTFQYYFLLQNICFPAKAQCFAQILTFKPHPWCSSSNAICQEWFATHKIRLARQYCREGTFQPALTQPFHCDLQTLSCKAQKNYAQRLHKLQRFAAPKPVLDAKAGKRRFWSS